MAPPSLTKNLAEVMGPADGRIPSLVTLQAGSFLADGHPILTSVPRNIVATPSPLISAGKTRTTIGCLVGFHSAEPKSRHVVSLGKLRNLRFMSIFRFKVWWTTHWVGRNGRDVEHETQMMILNKNDSGRPYVLLLPLLEGPFRASLQPGEDDNLDICIESGSTRVSRPSFRSCLYMQAGDDPFSLVREALKEIRLRLGTFKLLEEKTAPGIVDKFGWCTWDAFYLKVHPRGVWEGVKGLVEGGCPPGMVLIDDGWQSISHDDDPVSDQEGMNRTAAGEQMPCRLVQFEENHKFRDYRSPRQPEARGMGAFIRDLKEEFKSVEHVYVWHALCGYWGGVRPGVEGMPESRIIAPKLSPGLGKTMEDLAVDKIVSNGIGLVPPELAHELYDRLHAHLQSVGVDGVKVDVIHLLEMLCEEFGGRVELGKAYYEALSASVRKHFKGNGVIASMEHCNDFMFLGTETISLGRVGDDFWCSDPQGVSNGTFWLQGCHMVHCAYNSLWMGNFIHPDWDMFQSTHPCAEFHAASRAISGGPIYISDCVGEHNFELLRSLVLPDGSILRCQFYALPTRDCLFEDPLHDGKTMLKIWNVNKYTGVLGLFNCQGGGWCPITRINKSASEFSNIVSCTTGPIEIEWNNTNSPVPHKDEANTFAVYMFKEQKLRILKDLDCLEIALQPFNYELLTVSPVTEINSIKFAAIGLVNMLNTGGAVQSMEYDQDTSSVRVGVRGSGEMRVFTSENPRTCRINGVEVNFSYAEQMVAIQVPWPESDLSSVIEYLF